MEADLLGMVDASDQVLHHPLRGLLVGVLDNHWVDTVFDDHAITADVPREVHIRFYSPDETVYLRIGIVARHHAAHGVLYGFDTFGIPASIRGTRVSASASAIRNRSSSRNTDPGV